jgi:hypothetical protein
MAKKKFNTIDNRLRTKIPVICSIAEDKLEVMPQQVQIIYFKHFLSMTQDLAYLLGERGMIRLFG